MFSIRFFRIGRILMDDRGRVDDLVVARLFVSNSDCVTVSNIITRRSHVVLSIVWLFPLEYRRFLSKCRVNTLVSLVSDHSMLYVQKQFPGVGLVKLLCASLYDDLLTNHVQSKQCNYNLIQPYRCDKVSVTYSKVCNFHQYCSLRANPLARSRDK